MKKTKEKERPMYTNQNSNNTIQTSKQALNEDCSTVGNIIVEFSGDDSIIGTFQNIKITKAKGLSLRLLTFDYFFLSFLWKAL